MITLSVVNLAVAIILVFWPLWFSRRYLHFGRLNPLSIPVLVNFPVRSDGDPGAPCC